LQNIKIAIVGYGKIARDQHVPSIAATPGLELIATVSSRGDAPPGVPSFTAIDALAESGLHVDAVALCTPPEGRSAIAMAAVDFGWDILLEKPPGLNAAEVTALADYARRAGQIIFTTWHSQYNAAVDAAAARLANQNVVSMQIDWREDVRKWHPGQDWIWQPNGFGVFDPGINALSIATKIMPTPLAVEHSHLTIAENHDTPIAASINFGPGLSANFDWREAGDECWRITIETTSETLILDKGGCELSAGGRLLISEPADEYRAIYQRFAQLIETRQSHVDLAPLLLVQQAQATGFRETIAAFEN
jgi:D-galactose 1-dehydrogenase